VFFFLVVFLFPVFVLSPVYADYSSISLTPSEGVISGDTTEIKVLLDSGETEFVGVDFYLNFSGAVEFLGATGPTRCSSFDVNLTTPGTVNVTCLSLDHAEGETYSGVIATLTFKATGEGTSLFTFGETDPVITTKTGGEYTLSVLQDTGGEVNLGSLQDTGDEVNLGSVGDLPKTSIFDSNGRIIIAGIVLILLGSFLNSILDNIFPLFFSLDKKVKQQRVEKRRESLEKRF
jgi:hypothetical protein